MTQQTTDEFRMQAVRHLPQAEHLAKMARTTPRVQSARIERLPNGQFQVVVRYNNKQLEA